MANETVLRRKFQELSLFSAAIRNSMEEKTLKLAQKLAKEVTIEDDKEEARDGNPLPLKTKLEEKIKSDAKVVKILFKFYVQIKFLLFF